MSSLEFESLDAIMHNKIIVVPDYQRDYSWGKAEISTLIEDLETLYERNSASGSGAYKHFMGSVVLIPLDETISSAAKKIASNPKLSKFWIGNIIDGQQRISTLSVLFISLLDFAELQGIELSEAQNVKNLLDTGKKDAEGNRIPVLHFSQDNTQKCFDAMLFKEDLKYDARNMGARRLLAAKNQFDESLASLFEGDPGLEDDLNNYVDQVLYALQMVEINCGRDSDAFQIFESLNATGVPLTPAEQVKNLVLMRSESRDVSLSSWEKIVENVGEDDLVDFLSQFLFCRENHRVSRKDIYREFKDALKKYKVSEILEETRNYSEVYKALRYPSAGTPASAALKDLSELSQRQAYVPLMLAANRFGLRSKKFAKIADAVLVYIVRHQVCSQSTNKLDIVFSRACEIIKNEANNVDDIVGFFRKEQMDDAFFEMMFQDASFPYSAIAQRKARVYLKRLEEKSKGINKPLLLQTTDLSVEHVIPKQPSIEQLEGWIGKAEADNLRKEDPQLDDFSEQVIMNIGNLALLYTPENASLGNKSYGEKRNLYMKAMSDKDGNDRGIPSEVFHLINELVTKYDGEFTAESVKERAVELAKQAVNAWK